MGKKKEQMMFPKGAQLICRGCNIRAYNLTNCPRCRRPFVLAEPEAWMAEEKKEETPKRRLLFGRKKEKDAAANSMKEAAEVVESETEETVISEPEVVIPAPSEELAEQIPESILIPVEEVTEESAHAVYVPESTTGFAVVDELRHYKRQLDSGEITQEEFEEKKKRLLDL